MYKNPQRSIKKPLSIRLNPIPLNEKAAFVESVCSVLIESRFGPGRACQLVVDLSDRPELEPAIFYDLTDEGLVPCYAISPLGRTGYQVVEAEFRKAKQMGLVGPRPHQHPAASPLGRGSPNGAERGQARLPNCKLLSCSDLSRLDHYSSSIFRDEQTVGQSGRRACPRS